MLLGDAGVGFMGKAGVNAVKYNGSADYLQKGGTLTGVTNITQALISAWLRIDGGDGTNMSYMETNITSALRFIHTSANQIYFSLSNGPSRNDFAATNGGSGYLASAAWIHVLCAWKTAASRVFQIYINDVSDNVQQTGYPDDGALFTLSSLTDVSIAAAVGGGSNFFNGAMSEFYFAPNQYLDISVQANRRKFISSGLKPVSLGSDGSTPTGTAPAIYLPNPAATVNVNAGLGGNLTIHGSPTVASTTPG